MYTETTNNRKNEKKKTPNNIVCMWLAPSFVPCLSRHGLSIGMCSVTKNKFYIIASAEIGIRRFFVRRVKLLLLFPLTYFGHKYSINVTKEMN